LGLQEIYSLGSSRKSVVRFSALCTGHLNPQKTFLSEVESTPGPLCSRKNEFSEKNFDVSTGNRTSHIWACGAVPPPTAPLIVPLKEDVVKHNSRKRSAGTQESAEQDMFQPRCGIGLAVMKSRCTNTVPTNEVMQLMEFLLLKENSHLAA